MTHIELAIREAVEKGEWMSAFLEGMTVEQIENWTSHVWAAEAFLDPLFWQSLGKARGWEKKVVIRRGTVIGNFCTPCSVEHPRGECFKEMGFGMDY